jgi:predicted nucleic acid-binding protein
VTGWLEEHDDELHVSVITLGEIDKGIQLLSSGPKKQRLAAWFAELTATLGARIIPVDQRIMARWAQFYARHQLHGRLYPAFDSILAATALAHELVLVTRNSPDFPDEVKKLNPFSA